MSTTFVPDRWLPGERLAGRPELPSVDPEAPTIGVLALQGDVLEHLRALGRCGARAVAVRSLEHVAAVDGLVLPGGESTTIGKLLSRFGLQAPIRARIDAGLPVFGTCAGMILLSDELDQDETQPLIGGLHVRTRRNAFGRQVDSFDVAVEVAGIDGGPVDVSFIRAPRVEEVLAGDVEVLAEVDGHPVVVRQGALLATAFHPEVTGDDRLHAAFVEVVRGARGARPDDRAAAGHREG
ncbi:MAG: pyridoxal 5'-phosphate synthase glutaminase subunit PdxT [Nitriliruptoraceae bacterium]